MKLLKALIVAITAILPLSISVTAVRSEDGPSLSTPQVAPQIDRRKLLVGPRDSSAMPSLTSDPAGWILAEQQKFYRSMSLAIRDIGRNPLPASLTLIGLSFGYGILHAAGHGHGKAVVSAWLLGNDEVPAVIWAVLVGAGVITIGFSYLFGTQNASFHVLMTAGLALTISLVLFSVLALERPFCRNDPSWA